MQFINFHLMPYIQLDVKEAAKARSAWTVLPNHLYDPVKGADNYEEFIDQLALSESLGFDAAGVNEHHQTAYGLMPAPNLIASALIQRTKKLKIAILGRALPLVNNPLMIAEEFAMLDAMSRGRIITGFVRGIGAEYHTMGINPAFSHERFHEAHDLILRAWTEAGPFAYHSRNYNFEYVNIWPRVYQQPHPPIWVPSQGSGETIKWAAAPERRYPFMITFTPTERVVGYLNTYRDQCREYGYEAAPEQLGWALPIYVADTEERAIEEARHAMETLFADFFRMSFEQLLPPGYTNATSIKNTMKARAGFMTKRATIEELVGNGTVLVGTPKTVRESLERMRDRTNVHWISTVLQFGSLPNDLARRNMAMFASEVMPHLR